MGRIGFSGLLAAAVAFAACASGHGSAVDAAASASASASTSASATALGPGGSSVEADPTTGPVRRGPGPGGTDALAPQPSVTSTAAAPSASASGSAAVAVGPPPTFDIKNDCPDALALFVGPKPKGAAGATVNVAGRTTQSEKRAADGTQTVWIVDGKGEGVASARITATSKRVVVGSNCRSIQAE